MAGRRGALPMNVLFLGMAKELGFYSSGVESEEPEKNLEASSTMI
jgi:hypothetical protein